MPKPPIIVLCGAAGTGKTTVQQYLRQHFNLARVITHTTRPPRPGEVAGQDYYFETPASMAKLHLFEQVQYDHYRYGSSQEGLQRALADHPGAVMVLDTKGAVTYRKALGDQVKVLFLTVTDHQQLRQRLTHRGDAPAAIASRLASEEFQRDLTLPPALQAQALILRNDDWAATVAQLELYATQWGLKGK